MKRNLRMSIIENEHHDEVELRSCLEKYTHDTGTQFSITVTHNADDFLETFESATQPDIIFMDIDMPGTNGMAAARELRSRGCTSILIFVTTLAQYAIDGYAVDAADFMIKPLNYLSFKLRMDKAVALCATNDDYSLTITQNRNTHIIHTRDLIYVETQKHNMIFHLTTGQYVQRGSLSGIEEELKTLYGTADTPFLRVNSCYLINMDYVTGISTTSVTVQGGDELAVSRSRKKQAMQAITKYLGMKV